jgi:hypothetical protein
VALSQIHHQRSHDYTGWKVIAIPFQGGEAIQEVIKRTNEKKTTNNSEPYYWLADDRGSSDLVNLSFRVFGETTRGLYNGYFCLFGISILVAGLGLRMSAGALALLNMIVIAYGSFLPNINSAVGPTFNVSGYRVHLSETRLFEIMGLIFFIQFIMGIALNLRLRLPEIASLLVQGMILSEDSKGGASRIICVEQPEIHLHPRLQASMADFFINTAAKNNNIQWILETHSEALITRLQRRIREKKISSRDVSILYINPLGKKGSTIQELRLDEDGEFIDLWPDGFFVETFNDMMN